MTEQEVLPESSNPYAPSAIEESLVAKQDEALFLIKSARTGLRLALLILFAPALLNYFYWDREFVADRFAIDLVSLCRLANLSCIVLAFFAIWFLGMPLARFVLEKALPRVFGWRVRDWAGHVYQAMPILPVYAVLGAVLWAVWAFTFYDWKQQGLLIANVFAIAAHVLAATWYLPVLARCFGILPKRRLRESSKLPSEKELHE